MALTKVHNRLIEGAAVNVKDFGAVGDGVTDDTSAIQAAIDTDSGRVFLDGSSYAVSGQIDAENVYAWNGIQGIGHASRLEFGASSVIKIQNRIPGTEGGTDIWSANGIYDLAINGNNSSSYGVIVGTDTDLGQTSIDLTCNGASFSNVIIYDVSGPAWQCGFITNNVWTNCFTKDCDYGWFGYTNSNSTACDMWHLDSFKALSHNIAGVAAISDSVNSVSGIVTNGMFNNNAGWGAFLKGQGVYTFSSCHFEANGTTDTSTASNVTVKEDGVSREPSQLFVYNSTVNMDGCTIFNGFAQVVNNGFLKLDGCHWYNAGSMNPFTNCDDTATIIIDGYTRFDNPYIRLTEATFVYKTAPRITGTANDRSVICTRIPHRITKSTSDFGMTDPSFESGTDGWTVSGTPPTLTRPTTNPYLGTNHLRYVFNSSAGSINTNAARYNSIGGLGAGQYIAVSFFAYSSIATTMAIQSFNNEYGNNMGTGRFTLPANEWVRISCLWHEISNSPTTGNLFGIYPVDTDAPTVDIDVVCINKGTLYEVEGVLQGDVINL